MASISFSSSSLFSTILLLSFFLNAFAQGSTPAPLTSRPTVKDRIALVLPYINSLKQKIVTENNVTRTWVGDNVCKFAGFTCSKLPDLEKQNALAGVHLNGAKLTGRDGQLSLDGFINGFPDITFFHANSNNFTGTIPNINTSIIPYLFELDLSNNKLSGPFPTEVLGATNLTFLDLRYNQFTGPIPPQLFKMDIRTIFLNNNNFQQELPSNLGSTSALYLTIANNKLTGPIPPSIGQAQLVEINLFNNQLTGSLPPEIGSLKNLSFLDVGQNKLTGPIPPSIGQAQLVEINLFNNQLTGSLPPEIGSLKNLTFLDVGQNKLIGPIPNSFRCLKKIVTLNLRSNSFYGTIPDDFCNIKTLKTLYFADNFFTGVGPKCRKLIDKKVLHVDNNCIFDLPNQKAKAECEKFMSQPMKEEPRMLSFIPCEKV